MVGVHVRQLDVDQQQHLTSAKRKRSDPFLSTAVRPRSDRDGTHLIFSAALAVADVLSDDPLHLLSQHGILGQL